MNKTSDAEQPIVNWLTGGGEMGKLIKSKDWSKTPVGDIDSWPQSLRTMVSLVVASNSPISVIWGPGHVQIYNDGYWPICGDKHPASLGHDFRQCWKSAWPVIGAAYDTAWSGQSAYLTNMRMFLDRFGFSEETWFTFSFSPITDESGKVSGVFHPVAESTTQMLSERRAKTVHALTSRCAKAKTTAEALALASAVFEESQLDLPFVLLYVVDGQEGARYARRAIHTGMDPQSPVCPDAVDLEADTQQLWPVAEILQTGVTQQLDDIAPHLAGMTEGPYPEAPTMALAMPITQPGSAKPYAVMIAGISARLAMNESYRVFCDLVAATVSTALANAQAYEDERKLSAGLAELDRAKTAFFSNVSHEFRTPLTLMLGPLEDELVEPTSPLPPHRHARLETVHRNALRLLKLVNTLLDFSRVEAGRTQAIYQPINLPVLTVDLASAFRSAIGGAGVEFIVDCPPIVQPVYVDRDMWEKIVLNLLANALNFTKKGRIVLRQRVVDDHVLVSVEDTGCGIPQSELGNVFKRFHRVEGAAGRTHEGTCIGLALVEEFAKLHGGAVRVESALGAGSVFTVSIPLGKEHLDADKIGVGGRHVTAGNAYVEDALHWLPAHNIGADEFTFSKGGSLPPPGVRRPRVLVADDNADMRDYVNRLLGDRYEVLYAADGEEAWSAIQKQRPDLLLTDVMMPKLDGFGLLARIRKEAKTRTLPVIMLSARAGEESRVEGVEAGADDYLVKPFSARDLVARVASNVKMGRIGHLLEQSNAALKEAQEIAHIGSWAWDLVESRIECSDELYRAYGLDPRKFEASFESFMDRMHPDDLEMVKSELERARTKAGPFEFKVRILRSDSVIRIQQVRGRAHADESGMVVRLTGTGEDVTEREQLQTRLVFAGMASVGTLAAGIAHEINNPLSYVMANLDLIAEEIRVISGGSPSGRMRELEDMINEAREGSERVRKIVRGLKTFSRADEDRRVPLDVRRILDLSINMAFTDIRHRARLVKDYADVPLVEADEARLGQVFINLLVNAGQSIQEGQADKNEIRIVTRVDAGRVLIEVHDTGAGIAREAMSRIFDPFFTTKAVGAGTGLGLSICHGIVVALGGEIRVESEVGKGSTFRVLLPAAKLEVTAESKASRSLRPKPERLARVLVVDDDTMVASTLHRVLREHDVVVATSGRDALEHLARGPKFDVILCDLMMPEMTGMALHAQLSRTMPDQAERMVFITGGAFTTSARSFLDEVPNERLEKPFDASNLRALVQRMLR